MEMCMEFGSIEQGFNYDEEDDIPICKVCGMEESRNVYDEDYGKDR